MTSSGSGYTRTTFSGYRGTTSLGNRRTTSSMSWICALSTWQHSGRGFSIQHSIIGTITGLRTSDWSVGGNAVVRGSVSGKSRTRSDGSSSSFDGKSTVCTSSVVFDFGRSDLLSSRWMTLPARALLSLFKDRSRLAFLGRILCASAGNGSKRRRRRRMRGTAPEAKVSAAALKTFISRGSRLGSR